MAIQKLRSRNGHLIRTASGKLAVCGVSPCSWTPGASTPTMVFTDTVGSCSFFWNGLVFGAGAGEYFDYSVGGASCWWRWARYFSNAEMPGWAGCGGGRIMQVRLTYRFSGADSKIELFGSSCVDPLYEPFWDQLSLCAYDQPIGHGAFVLADSNITIVGGKLAGAGTMSDANRWPATSYYCGEDPGDEITYTLSQA